MSPIAAVEVIFVIVVIVGVIILMVVAAAFGAGWIATATAATGAFTDGSIGLFGFALIGHGPDTRLLVPVVASSRSFEWSSFDCRLVGGFFAGVH